MEYFENGDLAQHLANIRTEDEVRQITTDLLDGLQIIHSEGFAHRDLKPQVCGSNNLSKFDFVTSDTRYSSRLLITFT